MPIVTDLRNGFRLGSWRVMPDRGLLRDGETERHLEPKQVDVLLLLAAHQGQVVSKEQLIEVVWGNRAQSDEPLNRCVSMLRKQLGDDSSNPTFIETIPRRGYRLKMTPERAAPPQDDIATRNWQYWMAWAAGAIALSLVFVWVIANGSDRTPNPAPDSDKPMTSVAVFPFQCRGEIELSLCFGFSEALTSTLLSAEGIKVVKKGTPFLDQDSPTNMANQLGVDGLLSGSVQRLGDEVIISAELIDGRNGYVVFSDRIEGSVQDIFRLQEQVAIIVITKYFGGRPLHAAKEPSSFEAFEAYARGQYQFEIRDRDSIEESIDLFQQAIRLDPMFGPAYLGLAYSYLMLPDYDASISADAMYELAAATANAGIERDASIQNPAGTVFGFIHHKRGEWLQATEAYERAVTADTVYPISHHWYSLLLASVGRLDDALFQARSAHELDPDSAIIISRLAIANLWVGDLDQAGRYFGVVSKMKLEAPVHDLAAALYMFRRGQIDIAAVNTKRALAKNGLRNDWVEKVFAGLENPEVRQQSLNLLDELAAEQAVPRFVLTILWGLLGDADPAIRNALAIDNVEEAFEIEVLFIDGMQSLREHQDFPLLLDKVGLSAYWEQTGCVWVDADLECT